MLRVCVLLLAGLVALAACHSGPRAVIVASRGDGAAAPRCLDGSTRSSPAYQRICENVSRAGAKGVAAARLRPSVAGVEPVAAIRLSANRPSRASEARSDAPLLLPAAYTRSPSRTQAESEATPSFEERMRVRSGLLPPIVLPEIIDISGVLKALRGSVG